MKKLIFTLVVVALATIAANDAFAWPRLFHRNTGYAPAQQTYMVPAPVVAAQPQGQGYRAFSYEPAAPAAMGTYRAYRATPRGADFGNATRKMMGRY